MAYFGVLAGLVIGGLVLLVWYKRHKDIAQEGNSGFPTSRKARSGDGPNSLEEFIAAYRRGEVPAGGTAVPAPSEATAPDAPPVAAAPSKRDPFLGSAVKLAYYLCKTGLKDHHVFAHVQLATLAANSASDAALARGSVDLVVCNPAMSVVAAIDVIGPEVHAPDATKADYLRSLGIRYLRLSAKTLPKPEEIRALLYRM
ncbi:MAG: DUF2726 domain-containing protein [Pseudomonadota bacterium]